MYQLALFALTGLLAPAQDKVDSASRARVVAPYLDDQTIAVAHVDVTRIDLDALTNTLTALANIPPKQIEADRQALGQWRNAFVGAGGKDLYVVFSLADLPQRPPYAMVPLGTGANAKDLAALLTSEPAHWEVAEKIDQVLFAGSKAARQRLQGLKPSARPALAPAFAAAGDTALQILILPGVDTRRVIEQTLPTLPAELGGGPSTVLTQGVQWAAVGINPPPRLDLRLVIKSQDAAAAQRLADWTTAALGRLKGLKEIQDAYPDLERLLGQLTPKVSADRLTLTLGEKTLTEALKPALTRLRANAARIQVMNSLRQIGIALHNYHDLNGAFPTAAIYSKDGKPLLSWRVAILPFVEQNDLYKQFHLDEPWDSEHNQKLIAKIPVLYRTHPDLEAGRTTLLGVAGPAAMFPGRQKLTIRDVIDGSSNTLFVVDAAPDRAVVWSKPDDYRYDPKDPGAGLNGPEGGFLALFVDGSVRFISRKIKPETLNALFTRNGGEVVGEIP
jgi:hypothetical protein